MATSQRLIGRLGTAIPTLNCQRGGLLQMPSTYRPCVAAILEDNTGRILIGERADCPGAWQFPQGGLKRSETREAGLARELEEELSLVPAQYAVGECRGPYRYLFPPGYTKNGFHGQEQHYFRLRLLVPVDAVNVHTSNPEFCAVRWISPANFSLAWLPPMKREAYSRVFADFFGLRIA